MIRKKINTASKLSLQVQTSHFHEGKGIENPKYKEITVNHGVGITAWG